MPLSPSPLNYCFISYASENSAHALFLRDKLRKLFPETFEAFIDSVSLSPGAGWYEEIISHLRKASHVLILLDPASINRPWLLFEAGAAAAIGTKVTPLRFGGLSVDALPNPLASFHSIDLRHHQEIVNLLQSMTTALPPEHRTIITTAKKIAQHFGAIQTSGNEEADTANNPSSVNFGLINLTLISEKQRSLFFHVHAWTRDSAIRESHIRAGFRLPNLSDTGEELEGVRASPAEYYFRLRELSHLGLLVMKKINQYENEWSVHSEVKGVLASRTSS